MTKLQSRKKKQLGVDAIWVNVKVAAEELRRFEKATASLPFARDLGREISKVRGIMSNLEKAMSSLSREYKKAMMPPPPSGVPGMRTNLTRASKQLKQKARRVLEDNDEGNIRKLAHSTLKSLEEMSFIIQEEPDRTVEIKREIDNMSSKINYALGLGGDTRKFKSLFVDVLTRATNIQKQISSL